MSNFKVLLIAGHGAGDVGALGNGYKEFELTRELVGLIKGKLTKYASVDVYDTKRNAYKDAKNGSFKIAKYNYVLEVHFNAFNKSAHGTEIFVRPDEKGIKVEQKIMQHMKKFFKLRDNDNIFDGVKRERFLVIGKVKSMGMSGALLETCFIDNAADMNVYQKEKNAIAQAIAEGIAEGFGLKAGTTPEEKPDKPTTPPAAGFEAGDTVTLNKNATVYQGADKGKLIPENIKGRRYTVKKVSSSGKELLLNEITSWVLAAECSKAGAQGSGGAAEDLKVGDFARPLINYDYNGTKLISSVTKNVYKVKEIKGDRAVLGSGLNTAFRKGDLKKMY